MTGSAHGGPADDNDVGGVFRVCVGVEESARSAPSTWGVFDEPLTDHDHPPRTEAELAAAIAGLGHAVARRAVDGALDRLQSRWL